MKLAIKCMPSFLLKNRLGLPLTFFMLLNLSTIYGNSINLKFFSPKLQWAFLFLTLYKNWAWLSLCLKRKQSVNKSLKSKKQKMGAQTAGLSMCLFCWITGVSKQICFDLLQIRKHVKTYQPSQILSVVAKHTVYQCFLLIAYTVAACHSLICPTTVSSISYAFIYLWQPATHWFFYFLPQTICPRNARSGRGVRVRHVASFPVSVNH